MARVTRCGAALLGLRAALYAELWWHVSLSISEALVEFDRHLVTTLQLFGRFLVPFSKADELPRCA